jgi:hypothetical protein
MNPIKIKKHRKRIEITEVKPNLIIKTIWSRSDKSNIGIELKSTDQSNISLGLREIQYLKDKHSKLYLGE